MPRPADGFASFEQVHWGCWTVASSAGGHYGTRSALTGIVPTDSTPDVRRAAGVTVAKTGRGRPRRTATREVDEGLVHDHDEGDDVPGFAATAAGGDGVSLKRGPAPYLTVRALTTGAPIASGCRPGSTTTSRRRWRRRRLLDGADDVGDHPARAAAASRSLELALESCYATLVVNVTGLGGGPQAGRPT